MLNCLSHAANVRSKFSAVCVPLCAPGANLRRSSSSATLPRGHRESHICSRKNPIHLFPDGPLGYAKPSQSSRSPNSPSAPSGCRLALATAALAARTARPSSLVSASTLFATALQSLHRCGVSALWVCRWASSGRHGIFQALRGGRGSPYASVAQTLIIADGGAQNQAPSGQLLQGRILTADFAGLGMSKRP